MTTSITFDESDLRYSDGYGDGYDLIWSDVIDLALYVSHKDTTSGIAWHISGKAYSLDEISRLTGLRILRKKDGYTLDGFCSTVTPWILTRRNKSKSS